MDSRQDHAMALFTLATEPPAAVLARMLGDQHLYRSRLAARSIGRLDGLRRRRQPEKPSNPGIHDVAMNALATSDLRR